jgi:hypothetical protein
MKPTKTPELKTIDINAVAKTSGGHHHPGWGAYYGRPYAPYFRGYPAYPYGAYPAYPTYPTYPAYPAYPAYPYAAPGPVVIYR